MPGTQDGFSKKGGGDAVLPTEYRAHRLVPAVRARSSTTVLDALADALEALIEAGFYVAASLRRAFILDRRSDVFLAMLLMA